MVHKVFGAQESEVSGVGVLDRFERGVERAVQTVFAKAFKGEVEPVELASALRKEADTTAQIVGRGRTLVPNAYRITLGSKDFEKFSNWEDTLAGELAESVTEHAQHQRYSFSGPVSVQLDVNDQLETGVFQVQSAMVKGSVAPAGTAAIATVSHPIIDVDGRNYQLSRALTVVGRGSDADIVIDDPGVSRAHAEIRLDAEGATVVDLNSTNGTFVDGSRAGDGTRLYDGSVITLGRTRLVFHTRAGEDDE